MQLPHGSSRSRGLVAVLVAPIAALPLAAQCPNGPVFASPINSSEPPGPVYKLAHGDFDNDGDDDVVFRAMGEFHVRRNDGAAGFAAPLVLTVANQVRDWVVGDWDHDGRLDIAAAIAVQVASPPQSEVRVEIWRNGGPAAGFVTFAVSSSMLVSPMAAGWALPTMVSADFDSDGALDLAVHDTRQTVWVMRGAGSHGVPSGTFLPPVGYPLGAYGTGNLVTGDFNLDGAGDLALFTYAAPSLAVTVVEGQRGPQGQPLGTFGPLHSTTMPALSLLVPGSTSCGDLDADGLGDVLVSDPAGIKVIRNLGGFVFAPPVPFAVPGVSSSYFGRAFTGDFDRDGRLDIAAPTETNYTSPTGNFQVLRDPLGAAVWSSHSVAPGYPVSGASFDVDNDGVLDAAIGKNYFALTTSRGTCSVLPAPGIAVVSPNGGEFLLAGQQRLIQWTAATPVAEYDVDVSFDDGVTWSSIARNIAGTSCTWWVHEPSTNRGRFRVMPSNVPLFADLSDGPVTIGGPGLASAVPLGNGCGQPFAPLANATVPHLGGTTTLEMVGASPNVPAAWWLSVPVIPPLPVPGGINCLVWLDPAALSLLGFAGTDGNGRYALVVPVPANPALVGFALAAQATAFVPASALGLQISNGVGLVLGF